MGSGERWLLNQSTLARVTYSRAITVDYPSLEEPLDSHGERGVIAVAHAPKPRLVSAATAIRDQRLRRRATIS